MSPLSQARLLLPLLEAIRNHLAAGEGAAFRVTAYGFPCIEARTERGNVVGLMPHPEHAVEALTGPGTDGLGFFTSLLASV